MSLWHLLGFLLLCKLGGSIPIVHELYGEVTSPLYPKPYPNNYDDTTEIKVPKGYSVKLVFWQFDLEPSEGCFYDYVKISADKKDLGRFCGQLESTTGNPPVQKEFVSQGNQMLLTFHTDFSNEENGTTIFYKGFLAYYQAVDKDECSVQENAIEENSNLGLKCEHLCHNSIGSYFCSCRPGYELQADGHSCRAECSSELFTEASGYISSLEYPKAYPPDMHCNYSIRVDRGLTINLQFLEPFEIDDHQQVHCPYDQLQVYASRKQVGEYCGIQSPGIINSSSNAVDILFFTDESGDSRGWKIHYTTEVIKCPQPKTRDKFTVIRNPQQQYQYRDYLTVTCKTGYQLTEGNQKLMSFTSVCQDDGTWHRAMPSCKIVNCGAPPQLPKGSFKYLNKAGGNTYETDILYSCQKPYYQLSNREENVTYTCSAEGIWKDKHENKIPLCLPVCGKPDNPVVENQRIIAGKNARAGNFPWQAFTNIYGRGGGALLGDRWILTAAHTLRPKDSSLQNTSIDVFLGHTNLDEIMRLGIHPVRKVFIHPGYDQNNLNNFDNDIALLELENSVPLGPNLLPICLPDKETLYEKGLMGYVSGFGTEDQKLHDELKFVSLPMVSRENCRNWLNFKKSNQVFSDNMFCAGDKTTKKDACQGDSGGVFALKDEVRDHWVATGIVSWGIGCGRGYGFYTKVLQYVDWIKGIMENAEPR